MATAAVDEAKIEIGRVIQRAVAALGRHFVAYLLAALVLAGLPYLAYDYLLAAKLAGNVSLSLFDLSFWASSAVSAVANALLQAVVVRTVINDLAGRPADVVESLAEVAPRVVPLVLLSLLVMLLTILGLILLVVPGIMAMVTLWVAVPAMINEKKGVIASIERSADLTRGARWQIFALLLVYSGFYLLLSLGSGMFDLVGTVESPELASGVAALVETAVALVSAALAAALYVELKTAKEGAAADTLASIFD